MQSVLAKYLATALLILGARQAQAAPQEVVANVIAKAAALKALLSPAQQDVLQKAFTPKLARHWSNLPDFACGPNCRNGVKFENLKVDQLAAAKITGNFGDVVLGPGKDAAWPAKLGLKVSGLTALQQSLVMQAMDAYLDDADPLTARSLHPGRRPRG